MFWNIDIFFTGTPFKVVAQYSYHPTESDQFEFEKGDVISGVRHSLYEGWLTIFVGDQYKLIPSSYVEMTPVNIKEHTSHIHTYTYT